MTRSSPARGRRGWRIAVCLAAVLFACVSRDTKADEAVFDAWRYTVRRPAAEWSSPDFDDSAWSEGFGGFGTPSTPGARVGTIWSTDNIWLRKSFKLAAVPERPALLIHHDEDAEVFLNGQRVAALKGFVTQYKLIPLDEEGRDALDTGENLLAVHCRQTGGGQFIDVHVVDSENVPKLPTPQRSRKPFVSDLITKWGKEVTPENAWTEYPRPGLVRKNWRNLNGNWQYAVTPIEQTAQPDKWDGEILVPFCLESRLSGVQRLLDPSEALWYRRTFEAGPDAEKRTLLNFEAVDYRCRAWVNGQPVGEHVGGNVPFSFDITEAVKSGENELVVRVEDATEGFQLHGKQTLMPRGIWYTQVSGIWQTVWLEFVPPRYLADLKITTDADKRMITVQPQLVGDAKEGEQLRVAVYDGDRLVVETTAHNTRSRRVPLAINGAKLWSPSSPHLYDLQVSLLDAEGNILDEAASYAGIRDVGKKRDADGRLRFTLNGEVLFHWGPLDQGWWPDGLLTPPSDEAMLSDIEYLKSAGFNMVRKHIKVEPRRYYYHCDRLGMLLWQDQVSGGVKPKWTRLAPNPQDAVWSDRHHQQFMREFEAMVDALENHPSIVVWTPFNEAWGQHRTMEVGRWIQQRDPARLVNIASGGNFWPVGDVVDAHKYPHPGFPFQPQRFHEYIRVMGEFGGHGWPAQGHLWDNSRRNWGYGNLPQSLEEYKDRYRESIRLLRELRDQGIAAGVYTQTSDVEGEINGLLTYDREVAKIPADELREIHRTLFADKSGHDTSGAAAAASRKPGPVMDAKTIATGLESHDRALFIKSGWIRDPYIVLGPDDYYYLTGTTPLPGDPREHADPYNTGLGPESIVGWKMQAWRSNDLIHWESLGTPFSLKDGVWSRARPQRFKQVDERQWRLWAPELHFLDGRWVLVHTSPSPVKGANLSVTRGAKLERPFDNPLGEAIGRRHDPSLFRDDDGRTWMIWGATSIAPLKPDFSGFAGEPVDIGPSGRKMGHEGCLMRKIGDKYVLFGTGWSTDQGRKGSYNLYYATADKVTGPYGPRRFAGRFLGHGTPFQGKQGRWWCTAFYNANVPPLSREEARGKDLGETAQTINEQGVTIVPLDVQVGDNGEVSIRAVDPDYASPGPDEAQSFERADEASH